MKKWAFYKIISILLSIVLLIGAVPTSVIALDEESLDTTAALADGQQGAIVKAVGSLDTLDWIDTIPLQAGEKTLAELQTMTVDLASIPEVINAEHALQKGHVNRLHAQEGSLSTVIYQNQDGTKTAYLFSRPVKYVSADGTVRDKSTVILPILNAAYSHAMLDNSTKVYFGRKADDGTRIDFGSYTINMSPKAENASAAVKNEDGSILYNGVFGARTAVLYKAELNGVKEDIILFSNVGKSSFDFTLSVANATPVQSGGVWSFVNAEGKTVARLDRIWVKDSAGHTTEGSITVTPTEVAGCYDVRVSVAESFLNDASTVYPVYIDPTTTIYEDSTYIVPDGYDYSYTSILDTGLYETADARDSAIQNMEMAVEMGDPLIHSVGYDGKLVYKFPSFYETYLWEGETYHYNSDYSLNEPQIGRATLYFQELNGDSITLNVSAMTDTWGDTVDDSIAVYEDDLWDAYSTQLQTQQTLTRNTDGYYAADVTAIFKEWARYNEFERTSASAGTNPYVAPANGLVLSNDASYTCEIIATESYGNADVYVELDTSYFGGVFTVNNGSEGLFLKNNVITMDETTTHVPTVATFVAGEYPLTPNYLWRFEYVGDNQYYIYTSVDNDYMLYAMGSTLSIRELITGSESRYRWTISVSATGGRIIKAWNNRVLKTDGTSLTLTTELTSSDENYPQTNWVIAAASGYVNMTGFEVDVRHQLDIGKSQFVYLTVSPPNASFSSASDFSWMSTDSNVISVSDRGQLVAHTEGLVQITVTHKATGISKSFYIASYPTYYIRNVEKDLYISIDKRATLDEPFADMAELDDGSQQEWVLVPEENGGHRILSVYNGMFLRTPNTTIVRQTSDLSKSSTFTFTRTSSGYYKIDLEFPNRSLMVGFSNLSIGTYSNDEENTDYRDEWLLMRKGEVSYVEREGQHTAVWCWLATARMFANHYYPGMIQYTQEEVAEVILPNNSLGYVPGDSNYGMGALEDAVNAVHQYISPIPGVSLDLQYNQRVIYSESVLRQFIDNGHVILISRGTFGEQIGNVINFTGHASLIVGYVYVDEECCFVIQDPMPVNKGTRAIYSYDRLTYGLRAKAWEDTVLDYSNTDQLIWCGVATVNTDYATTTAKPVAGPLA